MMQTYTALILTNFPEFILDFIIPGIILILFIVKTTKFSENTCSVRRFCYGLSYWIFCPDYSDSKEYLKNKAWSKSLPDKFKKIEFVKEILEHARKLYEGSGISFQTLDQKAVSLARVTLLALTTIAGLYRFNMIKVMDISIPGLVMIASSLILVLNSARPIRNPLPGNTRNIIENSKSYNSSQTHVMLAAELYTAEMALRDINLWKHRLFNTASWLFIIGFLLILLKLVFLPAA